MTLDAQHVSETPTRPTRLSGGKTMTVEYIRHRVPDDRPAEFEAASARAAVRLTRSPQCVEYELVRPTTPPMSPSGSARSSAAPPATPTSTAATRRCSPTTSARPVQLAGAHT
ncbi:hypothetical protein GCM10010346_29220 [Streptomyces chryseus]|uniref:Uncharacterized protein n=2 Tax=Streptomyces chryseus TaxID=68186 RepID=A0ABQ3DNI7_9ACTN|nr:hypothetical protein GCM10010346_29220 [Streptomyces chryseus]